MQRQTWRALVVGALMAALAAWLTTAMTGGSWLAFIGWVVFFASQQIPLLLWQARAERVDRCSAWLLGRPASR